MYEDPSPKDIAIRLLWAVVLLGCVGAIIYGTYGVNVPARGLYQLSTLSAGYHGDADRPYTVSLIRPLDWDPGARVAAEAKNPPVGKLYISRCLGFEPVRVSIEDEHGTPTKVVIERYKFETVLTITGMRPYHFYTVHVDWVADSPHCSFVSFADAFNPSVLLPEPAK
jgi:hypothetical protein